MNPSAPSLPWWMRRPPCPLPPRRSVSGLSNDSPTGQEQIKGPGRRPQERHAEGRTSCPKPCFRRCGWRSSTLARDRLHTAAALPRSWHVLPAQQRPGQPPAHQSCPGPTMQKSDSILSQAAHNLIFQSTSPSREPANANSQSCMQLPGDLPT